MEGSGVHDVGGIETTFDKSMVTDCHISRRGLRTRHRCLFFDTVIL